MAMKAVAIAIPVLTAVAEPDNAAVPVQNHAVRDRQTVWSYIPASKPAPAGSMTVNTTLTEIIAKPRFKPVSNTPAMTALCPNA